MLSVEQHMPSVKRLLQWPSLSAYFMILDTHTLPEHSIGAGWKKWHVTEYRTNPTPTRTSLATAWWVLKATTQLRLGLALPPIEFFEVCQCLFFTYLYHKIHTSGDGCSQHDLT